jgi:hypothetical protein
MYVAVLRHFGHLIFSDTHIHLILFTLLYLIKIALRAFVNGSIVVYVLGILLCSRFKHVRMCASDHERPTESKCY